MYSLNIEAIAVVKNTCMYYIFLKEYKKCLYMHFQQQVQVIGKLTCFLSCSRNWNFLGDVEISWSLCKALVFPGGSDSKVCLQCRRRGFDPSVKKIPWRRKWLPTPVFLLGEFRGQKSLGGYSLWGCKELDMTKGLTLSLRNLNQIITGLTPGLWTKLFLLQGTLLPV